LLSAFAKLLREAGPAVAVARAREYISVKGSRLGQRGLKGAAARFTAYPTKKMRADRKTILLLLNEAAFTGAPILGWNLAKRLSRRWNVVIVLEGGGDLLPALFEFDVVGPLVDIQDPSEMDKVVASLKQVYAPHFVIANSVDTERIAVRLIDRDVPTVALVHEFASYAPPGRLDALFRKADEVVFPAALVRDSAIGLYPYLQLRETHILRQGLSEIPRLPTSTKSEPLERSLLLAPNDRAPLTLRQALAVGMSEDRPFVIIGLGTLDQRKGVDLFVACAVSLMHLNPSRAFRFVWVGDPKHIAGTLYGIALEEQIARSGLDDRLAFMPALEDLSAVYAHADAMFLSSRLDPLPNVAIEAALKGVPVVCFERGTGIAEIFAGDSDAARLVVPYMDLAAAAQAFVKLINDQDYRRNASAAVRRLAQSAFDFDRYSSMLEQLGEAAAQRAPAEQKQRAKDVDRLTQPGGLDPVLVFGRDARDEPAIAAETYLRMSEKIRLDLPSVPKFSPLRTRPGFNSYAYAHQFNGYPKESRRDPLAHFVEQGQPKGPWVHEVIHLASASAPRRVSSGPVALHGHFHYTDNIGDLLQGLAVNRADVNLYLTTTSLDAADRLEKATRTYDKGAVLIEVGTNRGRDIGPFIRVLKDHILGRYAVVGHLHGKRSVFTHHFDPGLGDRWRSFLWQHLVGPHKPVLDIVLERLAGAPDIGLVFPENDHLIGWELNRFLAEQLAKRIGVERLPDDIEFPVGAMFWARTEALTPLIELGITEADYPSEPAPMDGTILHALERLLPTVAERRGFRYATTYTPLFRR
jgi:glycosyltransferase involved in cell wall biosynthesis